MSQLELSRQFEEEPSKIWSILKDFGGIHRFHSGVEKSSIINGTAPSGLGAATGVIIGKEGVKAAAQEARAIA